MENKTNLGLLEYAKAQVGLPYWYGTYGQIANKTLYKKKKEKYPEAYEDGNFENQYGKRVNDCVGLIKGYLWRDKDDNIIYNRKQDKTVAEMYTLAKEKGNMSNFPKHSGQLLFMADEDDFIYHVGIYDDRGLVYHATNTEEGIVCSTYDPDEWQCWAQCPFCTDTSFIYHYQVISPYGLNVRKAPGRTKEKLTVLQNGTRVESNGNITKTDNSKWVDVTVEQKGTLYVGYCDLAYLQKM